VGVPVFDGGAGEEKDREGVGEGVCRFVIFCDLSNI